MTERPLAGFGIDGRRLRPGEVFIAITGARYDGHDFLDQAAHAGAALAIVERAPPDPPPGLALLAVDSTLTALHRLAVAHRARLRAAGCRVISVSGSNGKSTTRHLIHQVLSTCGLRGTQSPRSFNNHLGVPLTLLAARPEDDFVACEIGTNHPGEVAALGALAQPDIAVITNIGEEHLAFFGDLAGVAREEFALLDQLAPDALALLPAPPWLAIEPPSTHARIARFAPAPGLVAAALPGVHNQLNAAAAIAIARRFGIAEPRIRAALSTAQPLPGRSRLLFATDPTRPTLIDDSYNANPDSMRAALALLRTYPAPRLAVLGDMHELGARTATAHREIAALAATSAERCILIGPGFAATATPAPTPGVTYHPSWHPALSSRIAAGLSPTTTVLIKGSRAMALERVVEALSRRFGASPRLST
ncbi:Mur ligase family protein [Marichromatium bheemlicum]|uniref:UDP-N-acetylmuramoyl-tripeptide--D-alanyl-D-alanine ligase n=1 Tax=Marichromatium bheemlicum TaxID=365339 RepID=A0ABX1IBJ3_9GAMM|nr:UDP-N-acetylmuramoyl-tripeptide--D-alanyl-D-alanine ligase [Marichromatium bheemlicum]